MDGFFSFLWFFFNVFDGDILTFLPVDWITEASFDFVSFEFELFGKSSIGEPFIFCEGENNLKVVFRFFNGLDFGQMFHDGFIDLSDLLTNDIIGDEGFEPIFRELFVFVVIVLDFGFIFGKESVSIEISVRISVWSCDNVVDLFKEGSVFLSEFNFNFGDFRAKILIDLSLLDDVMVKSNGLDLLFQGWEFFDFLFDFFFNSKLNQT